jgi:hypothetical protein
MLTLDSDGPTELGSTDLLTTVVHRARMRKVDVPRSVVLNTGGDVALSSKERRPP